jgi:hypothetical protein
MEQDWPRLPAAHHRIDHHSFEGLHPSKMR